MIALLETVISAIVAAQGDRAIVSALVYQTVRERAGVMHERAQAAEGRAVRAERALERLCARVGYVEPLP